MMKGLAVVILSVFCLSACSLPPPPSGGPVTPFETDGCSCWPDGDYRDCCEAHDRRYWTGGSPEERKQADLELKTCVAEKGHQTLAVFMYWGVRAGGHGWLPTPFRWGFGHAWPRGYFQDSPDEKPGIKKEQERP